MNDLKDRFNKTIDFLNKTLRPDGEFIASFVENRPTQHPATISSRLQAISLFLTCADYLHRTELVKQADIALTPLQEKEFAYQNTLCLIDAERSMVLWNSLLAIIYLKKQECEKAFRLLQTIKKSICDESINIYYEPGTGDIQNKSEIPVSIGLITITFLHAYQILQDKDYLTYAKKCAEMALLKGRYDVYDAWSLRLLYEIDQNAKYEQHAVKLINGMLGASFASMSSLVAAITIQATIAWHDRPGFQEKTKEILNHLLQLQSDNGSFIKSNTANETRIDYNVHSIWALLQYLEIIEKKNPNNLALIV